MENDKREQKSNKKKYIFITIGALILLAITLILSYSPKKPYTSKKLGIKFEAPQRYKVGENQQVMMLKDGADEIDIVRHPNSSKDIQQFINLFEKENNIDITVAKEKRLDGGVLYTVNIQYMTET